MINWLRNIFWLLVWLFPPLTQAAVTVAVITPRAGVYLTEGTELLAGVQNAVDEINEDGGLLKQKINILPIDDQCNDNIAVSTAQMLSLQKHRNIALVIGPYCDNALAEVAEIYAQANIVQIIPNTVSDSHKNTKQKGLIKMLGYSSQQAADFFDYYNTHLAGEVIALISNTKNIASIEMATAIQEQFQKHGKLAMLKNYTYQQTNKDYESLAAQIVADGVKVAFVTGSAANIKKIARYLKSEWHDFMIFTDKYAATKEYFKYLGDDAEGTYFMSLSGQTDDPEFAETMVALRLSGLETEGLSLFGYTAVKIWEFLARQAGTFNYAKVAKKINGNKIRTPLGRFIFNTGAPKNNEKYTIYLYQDSVFHRVY